MGRHDIERPLEGCGQPNKKQSGREQRAGDQCNEFKERGGARMQVGTGKGERSGDKWDIVTH